MSVTSPQTHGTLATREAFVTKTDASLPSDIWCNRVTITWVSGAHIYLGLPRPAGLANAVSATVYNEELNSANPSFTLGPIDDKNSICLTDLWRDASTGAVMLVAPVQV